MAKTEQQLEGQPQQPPGSSGGSVATRVALLEKARRRDPGARAAVALQARQTEALALPKKQASSRQLLSPRHGHTESAAASSTTQLTPRSVDTSNVPAEGTGSASASSSWHRTQKPRDPSDLAADALSSAAQGGGASDRFFHLAEGDKMAREKDISDARPCYDIKEPGLDPELDDLYEMNWSQQEMEKQIQRSVSAATLQLLNEKEDIERRVQRSLSSSAPDGLPERLPPPQLFLASRAHGRPKVFCQPRPEDTTGYSISRSIVRRPWLLLGALAPVVGLSAWLRTRLVGMREGLLFIPTHTEELLRDFPASSSPGRDAFVFWCERCSLLAQGEFKEKYEATVQALHSLRVNNSDCTDLSWSGFDAPAQGLSGNAYFSKDDSVSFIDLRFVSRRCMTAARKRLKALSGTRGKVLCAQGGPEAAAAASMEAEWRTSLDHCKYAVPICAFALWMAVGNVFRVLTPFLCVGLALLTGQAATAVGKAAFPSLDVNFDDSMALFVVLALCVDYALFFWSRFNLERLRRPGAGGYAQAVAVALHRSGQVVVASNCFVTLAYAFTMLLPSMNSWAYLGLCVESMVGCASAALYSMVLTPSLASALPLLFDRGRCPLDRVYQLVWWLLPSPRAFWAWWGKVISGRRCMMLTPLIVYFCMAPCVYLLAHYSPSYDVEAMGLRDDVLEPQALRRFESHFNVGMLYPVTFVLEAQPLKERILAGAQRAGGSPQSGNQITLVKPAFLEPYLGGPKSAGQGGPPAAAAPEEAGILRPMAPVSKGVVLETDDAHSGGIKDAMLQTAKVSASSSAASFLQLGRSTRAGAVREAAEHSAAREGGEAGSASAGREDGKPVTWQDMLRGSAETGSVEGAQELAQAKDMQQTLNFWKRHSWQSADAEDATAECISQPLAPSMQKWDRFVEGKDIVFSPEFGKAACTIADALVKGSHGQSWEVRKNDILSIWWMPRLPAVTGSGVGFRMGGGVMGSPSSIGSNYMRNQLIARELVGKVPEILRQSVSSDGNKILLKVASNYRPSSPASHELDSFIRRQVEEQEPLTFELAGHRYGLKVQHSSSMQLSVDAGAALHHFAPKVFGVLVPLVAVLIAISFGSVFLAPKLALTVVAPILTTYGLAIAVYQMNLLQWTGFKTLEGTGGMDFRLIVLTAGILLGFALDYDLFLFARVYEYRLEGYDNQSAVKRALAETGPAIVTAGTMMAVSFFSLMMAHTAFVRIMGFIFFVGVVLDVIVVRMLLAPVFLGYADRLTYWPTAMPPATKTWGADDVPDQKPP